MVILAVAIVLLILLRWRNEEFDWGLFSRTLVAVRWPWLAVAAGLSLASYYVRALRWAVIIRHLTDRPNTWRLFSATAIGFAAIFLLGRAGELVRPYVISLKERLSLSSQVAAWMIERICDLLAALLIFGFSLWYVGALADGLGPPLEWVFKAGGYIAGAIALVCVVVVVVFRRSSQRMRRRLLEALSFLPQGWHRRAEQLLDSFLLGLEATKTRGGLLWLGFYTAFDCGLIILCYGALFRTFSALDGLGMREVIVVLGFAMFGSVIQIPAVGGGVQLVTVVVLTELYRLPLEVAGGLALMIWLIAFAVIVPPGLVLLVHEGLNWRRLMRVEKEVLP